MTPQNAISSLLILSPRFDLHLRANTRLASSYGGSLRTRFVVRPMFYSLRSPVKAALYVKVYRLMTCRKHFTFPALTTFVASPKFPAEPVRVNVQALPVKVQTKQLLKPSPHIASFTQPYNTR